MAKKTKSKEAAKTIEQILWDSANRFCCWEICFD